MTEVDYTQVDVFELAKQFEAIAQELRKRRYFEYLSMVERVTELTSREVVGNSELSTYAPLRSLYTDERVLMQKTLDYIDGVVEAVREDPRLGACLSVIRDRDTLQPHSPLEGIVNARLDDRP